MFTLYNFSKDTQRNTLKDRKIMPLLSYIFHSSENCESVLTFKISDWVTLATVWEKIFRATAINQCSWCGCRCNYYLMARCLLTLNGPVRIDTGEHSFSIYFLVATYIIVIGTWSHFIFTKKQSRSRHMKTEIRVCNKNFNEIQRKLKYKYWTSELLFVFRQ